MTQNVELDYQDPVHEGFFDAIQELLGAAAPSLNIVVASDSTLKLVASTDNGQQSVAINGRYRWITADSSPVSVGALGNGTANVFVTASDNDFSGALGDIDAGTDYTFGLEILAAGSPTSELSRKVGEVLVLSGKIVRFWQTVGQRNRAAQPIYALAEHASQSALVAKGAASQAADIARVEKSDGTTYFSIDKDGKVRFLDAGPTIAAASDQLTLTGKLKTSGQVAFNGQTPAARPDYTLANVSTDRTIDFNGYTVNELGDVLGTLINDLIAIGLLQ